MFGRKKNSPFALARKRGASAEISNVRDGKPVMVEFSITEDGAEDTAELADELVRLLNRANVARHKKGMVQITFRGNVTFHRGAGSDTGRRNE